MKPRFNFFDKPKDVFEHADQIEIKLHRMENDKLAIEFKVSGSIWPDDDDDDETESGGTCCERVPDASELAGDLLRRFVSARKGVASEPRPSQDGSTLDGRRTNGDSLPMRSIARVLRKLHQSSGLHAGHDARRQRDEVDTLLAMEASP